ncbi:MAG: hypothetical protein ABH879_08245 [archaeon]
MHTKASLSLSINAIVVLILAITMLGLGLGFMKDTFSSTTEQFDEVSENMRAQLIEDIKQTNSRIAFDKIDIEVKRADKRSVYFGVKNDLAEGKTFQIDTKSLAAGAAGTIGTDGTWTVKNSVIKCYSSMSGVPSTIDFSTFESIRIEANDVAVLKMDIVVPSNAASTTYSCAMIIEDPVTADSVYDRKDFYITVP